MSLALTKDPEPLQGLAGHVAQHALSGVSLALAIAMPFVVAAIVFEVAAGIVAKTAPATALRSLWVPLRSVLFLILLAAMFDRIVALIVLVASRAG